MTTYQDPGKNSAYNMLFADLMEEVLTYASDPKLCGDNITEKIRQLTGVRVVTLVQRPLLAEGEYQILSVCPSRHTPLTARREVLELACMTEQFCEPEIIQSDNKTPAGVILTALGLGTSMIIPLKVANEPVGALLLLDILSPIGIESVTRLLHKLAPALALVLRNAILFNQMETLVAERTKALQEEIMERQRTEKELIRAKEEWERTFESIGDIAMILQPDLRISRANQQAALAFSTTVENLLGRFCYEVFRGESQPCAGCPVLGAYHNSGMDNAEIEHKGLRKIFQVSSSPVFDGDGQVASIVHFAKDITSRKEMESR